MSKEDRLISKGLRSLTLLKDPWVTALLAVATAIRIPALTRSFYGDEYYAILLAHQPVSRILTQQSEDTQPPLYFLLLHFWTKLFPGEAGARSLSLVFGLLSLVFAYLLVRELFGRRVGLASLALLAISPFHLEFSLEVRMYSLALLCATAAAYYTVLLARRPSVFFFTGYVLAAGMGFYAHLYTSLFFAVNTLAFLILAPRTRDQFVRWGTAQIAALALLIPWSFQLYSQINSALDAHLERAFSATSAIPKIAAAFSLGYTAFGVTEDQISKPISRTDLIQNAPVILTALFAFGIILLLGIKQLRREPKGLAVILGYLTLPVFGAYAAAYVDVIPALREKYLIEAITAYYALLGAGLATAWRRGWTLAPAAVLLGLYAYSLGNYYFAPQSYGRSEDWRGLSTYLAQNIRPGDTIVTYDSFGNWYLGYYNPTLNQRVLPIVDKWYNRQISETEIERRLQPMSADYTRIWFIDFVSQRAEFDEAGLVPRWLDIHLHQAQVVVFTHRLSLVLYTHDQTLALSSTPLKDAPSPQMKQ